MSEQIAVRIPASLDRALDELVAEGGFRSKAALVRTAIERFIESERRRRIGEEIAQGYVLTPQTDEDEELARDAAIRSINEEPW